MRGHEMRLGERLKTIHEMKRKEKRRAIKWNEKKRRGEEKRSLRIQFLPSFIFILLLSIVPLCQQQFLLLLPLMNIIVV
jgi:hypothetical protein